MSRWTTPDMRVLEVKLSENIALSGGTVLELVWEQKSLGKYYCNTSQGTVMDTGVTYEVKGSYGYVYNNVPTETIVGCQA